MRPSFSLSSECVTLTQMTMYPIGSALSTKSCSLEQSTPPHSNKGNFHFARIFSLGLSPAFRKNTTNPPSLSSSQSGCPVPGPGERPHGSPAWRNGGQLVSWQPVRQEPFSLGGIPQKILESLLVLENGDHILFLSGPGLKWSPAFTKNWMHCSIHRL